MPVAFDCCNACQLKLNQCICARVDKFFDENRELMDDLQKLEEKEKKSKPKQCLACFFAPCRCFGKKPS